MDSAVQEVRTCRICGQTKTLFDFYERSDRPGHRVSQCITCKKAKYQEAAKDPAYRKEKLERSKKWQNENPLRARYLRAKSNALNDKRRKSREFALTMEECVQLWSKGCHYCGVSILNETGTGLDRKDNSLDYVIDNVLPCCGDCNKVRNTVLSVQEMEVAMAAVLALRRQ